MTVRKITFLCCLPALFITDAGGAEPLVVGPGNVLQLQTPEDGARLEAALDGGPLKPVGQTMTVPTAGDHWLAVASRDPVGNLSPIRWIRLRVDSEAPRVALRTEPSPVHLDQHWMPPSSPVMATAEDDLAGIARLFLAVGDEVREVSEQSVSAELPPLGEVTVRAWALDHAGNRSTDVTLDLAIDSTPPRTEIRTACSPVADAPPAGVTGTVVAPDCRIAVDVFDDQSGVATWDLEIDSREVVAEALSGPWTAGPHVVEVTATDEVGNEARVDPFPFTVDDTGPEIAWRVSSAGAADADGNLFYRPPVDVVVEARDVPAGIDQLASSTDGRGFQPIAGPVVVDGERLLLRATDQVGNIREVEASWRLDRTAPEIQIETEGGETISPGSTLELERGEAIRFRTVDRGVGVETATYSIRVESAHIGRRWFWWPPYEQPIPERLVFPWPGKLSLSVEAVDRLGNRQTARWTVVVQPQTGGA